MTWEPGKTGRSARAAVFFLLGLGLGGHAWALSCGDFHWQGIPVPAGEHRPAFHERWDPPLEMRHADGAGGVLQGYIKQTGQVGSAVGWKQDALGRPICISDLRITFGLARAKVSVFHGILDPAHRRAVLRHERCHQIYYIDVARRLRVQLERDVRRRLASRSHVSAFRPPLLQGVRGRSPSQGLIVLRRGAKVVGHGDPFGLNELVLRYRRRLESEIYEDPRHREIDRTLFTGMECRAVLGPRWGRVGAAGG